MNKQEWLNKSAQIMKDYPELSDAQIAAAAENAERSTIEFLNDSALKYEADIPSELAEMDLRFFAASCEAMTWAA
jgi:hypothetical protein